MGNLRVPRLQTDFLDGESEATVTWYWVRPRPSCPLLQGRGIELRGVIRGEGGGDSSVTGNNLSLFPS